MKETWVEFNADNDGFSWKPKLIHFPYMCTLSAGTFPFSTGVTPLRGRITYAFGLLQKELVDCLRRYFSFFL